MARTHTFNKKDNLVSALRNVNEISRFLALQLAERGYVKINVIQTGKRGRPQHEYLLTGKARGYLALAKNWGCKSENLTQNFQIEA